VIVNAPRMKDFYIGGASVKLFVPIFKRNCPEIVDIKLLCRRRPHKMRFLTEVQPRGVFEEA
jgi:hypothetical protein